MERDYRHAPFALTVGAIVAKENQILLVKHSYGPTKGKWDFVRGYVEPGETVSEAVKREVLEETGIVASPSAIVGVRNQVKQSTQGQIQNDLLVIYRMQYVSGEVRADHKEIVEAIFMDRLEALSNGFVGDWAKSIVRAMDEGNGLIRSAYEPRSLSQLAGWEFYS